MAGVQGHACDSGPRSLPTKSQKCSEAADKAVDKLRGVKVLEKYKMCLKIEFAVLCAVIVVIWGLLSIPVILYHVPLMSGREDTSAPDNNTISNSTCTSAFLYNGTSTTCEVELQKFRQCLPDAAENNDILVLQDGSEIVESILDFLELDTPFFSVSSECREAATPLLCLFYFGPVCDSAGIAYRLSTAECLQVSTNVSLCGNEWKTAQAFDIQLPDCYSDMFTNEVEARMCVASGGANITNQTESSGDHGEVTDPTSTEQMDSLNGSSACSLQCSNDFYCKTGVSGDSCAPSCSWKELPAVSSDVIDAFVVISAVIGVLAATVVIVTGCMRSKRVFVFPSVIVIYQTITLIVIGVTVLISYTDRATLYCPSNDLLESINEATPFCVLTGIIFEYGLLQLSCWWFCHVCILFWKIKFPFQARSFDVSHRTRYIHIVCLLVCLIFPLLPIIVIIGHDLRTNAETAAAIGTLGFGPIRFPPILCVGLDGDAVFYSLVLPIILTLAVGMALLVLIFWFVRKQNGLFKAKQAKSPYKIGTAEKKLLVIILYYVLLAVFALTTFTISTKNAVTVIKEILLYFICERDGINPSQPCDRSRFEEFNNPVPGTLSFILLGLFPCVNLIFTVNVKELREKIEPCVSCVKRKMMDQHGPSEQSTTSSSNVKGETVEPSSSI